ncbi:hypothetical protein [uncultured Kordia sp.]|uniref:hypothetical protein n=1 Tax=uncultured Kordia sp. TaxID=507699 RepID=UPI00261299E3|nr:hypothetical protein [uncultured Kordia sp.]
MKRFLASVVFLLIAFSCFSQELNNYKYVVVPYKFDFLKKHDKYRVNTLVRHLFKKEGFVVLYDTEDFPKELGDDRCMGMYVDIKNDSNIFTTKMSFIIRDCSNKIILETPIGRSKIKAYEKAYNQALRSAFESIQATNYSYEPKKKEVVEVPPPPPPVSVVEEAPKKVVETKAKVEETVKETVAEKPMVKTVTESSAKTVLYAQPIENGYQLVDTTPKVVMILLKTGVPNVYLVKGQDATVYKENGKWILSKSSGEGTKKKELDIKF